MSKDKTVKSTPTAPSGTTNGTTDFFESLGNKGILIALFAIMIIAFFVFKDFILYKKAFLYKDIGSDTLNGVLPTYYGYADYLSKTGIPRWSFSVGMGQNTFGGFLRDPFQIITFLAGPSSLPRIMIFIELLKLTVGGLVFYLFLKTLKASNFSAVIGAVLFSFCGFMIIGACWYVFTYEAFNLALLLLAFELLFQKNKWPLFIIAIILVAISTPSNLFGFGLFLGTYAIFRAYQLPDFNIRKLGILFGKMIMLGAIGLLISAPLMMETLMSMIESPRGSGENSYVAKLMGQPMFHLIEKEQFGAFIMRFFSTDMLGSGSNYSINGVVNHGQFEQKNWGNFLEAPVSYCGILSMVLMSQVFFLMDKASRRGYIALLVVWLIPVIFPWFRYAFWLFNGDYYRLFSVTLALIFIIYSVKALDLVLKNRKVNLIALGVTVLVLLVLESYPYFKDYQKLAGGRQLVDTTISMFAKAFIVLYALVLFMMSRAKNQANFKYALLGLVIIELIYLSSFTINRRDAVSASELQQKVSVAYKDYSEDAVDYVKKTEKAPFYRIDKNYFSSGASNFSLNDNQVQGFYTTSSYNSFAQLNFINYLVKYNVINKENEYESRWVSGLINPPNRLLPIGTLEALNNVKYIFAKRTGAYNPNWKLTHDSVASFNDVVVLKSRFALPFGYTYDQYITQDEFDKLTITQKELVSTSACILKPEDVSKSGAGLKHYNLADTLPLAQFNIPAYKDNFDKLKKDSLNISLFSQNKIEGKVNVSENKVMYLSFPNDKGWHLKVDGVETEKLSVNNGMTGIYLPKGNHSIEMEFRLRFFNKGLILMIIGLVLAGAFWFFSRKKQGSADPDVVY